MEMDDDEIVAELPVFLNQDLAKQLYLLQYPLRPAQRPYSKDLGELTHVRVKPHQKKVIFSLKSI
jgi:DNA-directed RNA polymerase III subunit RPC5